MIASVMSAMTITTSANGMWGGEYDSRYGDDPYDDDSDLYYWGNPELFQGSTIDVGGEHGKVLNYDRALYTYERDGVVYEAGIAPIDSFYIDTTFIQPDWSGDGGASSTYPLSYTFEMDVMYTSLETVEPGHFPLLETGLAAHQPLNIIAVIPLLTKPLLSATI